MFKNDFRINKIEIWLRKLKIHANKLIWGWIIKAVDNCIINAIRLIKTYKFEIRSEWLENDIRNIIKLINITVILIGGYSEINELEFIKSFVFN